MDPTTSTVPPSVDAAVWQFALLTDNECAESLPYGDCPATGHAGSTEFVCTNNDVAHEKWRMELYDSDSIVFTMDWNFQAGAKSLEDRFVDARSVGELVNWEITMADGTEFHRSALWRFSTDGTTQWGSGTSGFSTDDGAWMASNFEVNGGSAGDQTSYQSDGFGIANHNSGDSQCSTYYVNGQPTVSSNLMVKLYLATGSENDSATPTSVPTLNPSTSQPTHVPTVNPTTTQPTSVPTVDPTTSIVQPSVDGALWQFALLTDSECAESLPFGDCPATGHA